MNSNQKGSMANPEIDAEDQVERAAFLREHGWRHDETGWHHPRLPALPGISMKAARELQDEARRAFGPPEHLPTRTH